MIENIIQETSYVEQIYGEYISHVNRYQNLNRTSIFARYLNVNKAASAYNTETEATYDKYKSGIHYDIYDYTPLFLSSPVVNEAENSTDLKGQQFTGQLNVTIYTIDQPRIEDLLIFNRPPQKGLEIFRVMNVRASLNAMKSDPNANWFELTLEYSPLSDISKLLFVNHYVYSLPLQKNLFAKEFELEVRESELVINIFQNLQNFFDQDIELYYTVINDQKIAPLQENFILYNLLAFRKPYEDHFCKFKRPFAVNRYGSSRNLNLETKQLIDIELPTNIRIYDEILSYDENTNNIYELAHIALLWIWFRDRTIYNKLVPKHETNIPTLKLTPDLFKSSSIFDNNQIQIDVSKLPLTNFKG